MIESTGSAATRQPSNQKWPAVLESQGFELYDRHVLGFVDMVSPRCVVDSSLIFLLAHSASIHVARPSALRAQALVCPRHLSDMQTGFLVAYAALNMG